MSGNGVNSLKNWLVRIDLEILSPYSTPRAEVMPVLAQHAANAVTSPRQQTKGPSANNQLTSARVGMRQPPISR
jgi:hypothetical protein